MNPDIPATAEEVVYPDSDGQPMADNTLQWDWMVKIVGELREMYAGQQVFVAGDLLWYPVKGDNKTRTAPDAMIAFGRPPGYRGSYKQWEEGNIAPQVVFEVLSPSNTRDEMDAKRRWYEKYGVQEYYFIDPYGHQLLAFIRNDGRLDTVYPVKGYVSPLLGIRFDVIGEITIYAPDGRAFRTREERVEEMMEEIRMTTLAFEDERTRAVEAIREADLEHARADQEQARADQEHARADQEHARAEREQNARETLAAKLRELGVNPDDVLRPAS